MCMCVCYVGCRYMYVMYCNVQHAVAHGTDYITGLQRAEKRRKLYQCVGREGSPVTVIDEQIKSKPSSSYMHA